MFCKISMTPIREAHQLINDFENIAQKMRLSTSDLEKLSILMSHPNETSLRLFLAVGAEESSVAQWMAQVCYARQGSHSCYLNDSFCIAHLFNLEEDKKRESSLNMLKNSIAGYFEPVTHGGFRLADLLEKYRVTEHHFNIPPEKEHDYYRLSYKRIKKIAQVFKCSDEDLEHLAEDVCKWALNTTFGVDNLEYSFSASSPPKTQMLRTIARSYISQPKLSEILELIYQGDIPKDWEKQINYRPHMAKNSPEL